MIHPEFPEPKSRVVWKTIGKAVVVSVCFSILFVLVSPIFEMNPARRGPSPCKRNLKQIGLALHNYYDTYKSFPPAFVLGPDGKPWHSWRVLILPFLEEQLLFEKYRFDEPWNGPNNSKRLAKRPEAFACRSHDGVINVSKWQTSYVAVIGPETVWPGTTTIQNEEIADGTSNTAFVVEVREAGIPWMAPDDLSFEEASHSPTATIGRHPGSLHTGGAHILLGDGTVRFVNSELNPEIWKALWTRDGGETIPDF